MRMSCRIIAQRHPDISAETLRKRLQRKHHPQVQLDGRMIFNDIQEAALVGLITCFSSSGRLLTKIQLIDIARKFGSLPKDWDGWSWLYHFLGRHTNLVKISSAKGIEAEIKSNEILNNVYKFVIKMEKLWIEKPVETQLVFNTDETWVQLKTMGRNTKYVVSRAVSRASVVEDRSLKHITLLPFICADGSIAIIYTSNWEKNESNKVAYFTGHHAPF